MQLTINAVSCPLSQKEPVPRDEMIKTSKAKSEEAIEDIKVVLGWVYNTRTLCVRLLGAKFIAWAKTMQDILSKFKTKVKNLETLMGRLNYIASIVPLARHLLAIIMYSNSKTNAFPWYQLRPNICNDMKLHMRIPHKSHRGIWMNLLTYHKPTHIYLTYA